MQTAAPREAVCVFVCVNAGVGGPPARREAAPETHETESLTDLAPLRRAARPMQCNAATHLHSTSARRDDDDDDDGRTPRVGPGSSHADHGAKGAPSP